MDAPELIPCRICGPTYRPDLKPGMYSLAPNHPMTPCRGCKGTGQIRKKRASGRPTIPLPKV
jgi:hypothetical protein